MDDKEIKKINEIVKTALEESIRKLPTPRDEAVVIHSVDGRRVELHSSRESINQLLSKATTKLNELKESNGNNKRPGYTG